MDSDARARAERDRGLHKVNTGTRWLAAGAAVAVAGFSGGLALPHLVARVQNEVDTTSGSSSDVPADPATATDPSSATSRSVPSSSPSNASPPTTARSTPTTTGALTPPTQAPSAPRRRSHAVTGAS